jgi:hypothetical protein
MLSQIYREFYRGATGVNLLFLGLLFSLFVGLLLPWAETELKAFSNGTGPLDLLSFYTPDEAYTMLQAYGGQGRLFYTMVELSADVLYPLVSALLMSGLIIYVYSRVPYRRATIKTLFLFPLFTLLADYAENVCIVTMLINYPYRQDGLAIVSTIFTGLKWLLVLASLGIIVHGMVALAWAFFRSRFRTRSSDLKMPWP